MYFIYNVYMSVMGFKNSFDSGWVGGWMGGWLVGELYPGFCVYFF